jgi:CBS domain-containing membrane protein
VSFRQCLQALFADPVQIGFKEKIVAVGACLAAIFFTGQFSRIAVGADAGYPLLVASMGSSAAILFAIPNSPLAQPWPFAGSQLLSALAGVACQRLFPDMFSAGAFAVGSAMLLMLLMRCLHPPSAGTALVPVVGGEPLARLGFDFVLVPVGINVLFMLAVAIIINRWLLRRNYPLLKLPASSAENSAKGSISGGYNEADIVQALRSFDHFIDVSSDELGQIFSATEKLVYMRLQGEIRCADIMRKNIISVSYATEVEDAWALMQRHNLKAMPVLSPSRHVIGIITPQDFFKYVDLNAYGQFGEKFRAFIRRTTGTSTDKPEASGHIMTRQVVTLAENAHIAELIPLMRNHGHRHIPVIDSDGHFVGMVYQGDLVAALYHRSAAASGDSSGV